MKRHRIIDILVLVDLLVAGLKYVYGLEDSIDIHLYDETIYLYKGVSILEKGLPYPSQGPLYSLWYFLLSQFQPDRIKLFYLNVRLLTILIPILFYTVLRRYKLAVVPAFLISLYTLIGYFNLPVWPKVNHFTALVILLSLFGISYLDSSLQKLALINVFAFLCILARPEFLITSLLFIMVYVVVFIRKTRVKFDRKEMMIFITIVLLGLVMFSLFGLSSEGERSRLMVAFGQHFANNWVVWSGSERFPWNEWEEILSQNFGETDNLVGLMFSNPAMFFNHFASNLAVLPINSLLVISVYNEGIANQELFSFQESGFFLAILAILAFLDRKLWVQRFHENWMKYRNLLVFCGSFLIVSLIISLFIFPRYHYLVIPGILLLIILGLFLGRHQDDESINNRGVVLMLILSIFLIPAIFLFNKPGKQKNLETIKLLRTLHINQPVHMLEAEGGFDVYMGDNFERVSNYDKDGEFEYFMDLYDINVVVISERLLRDYRFSDDLQWIKFLEDPKSSGYQKIDVPNSQWYILVKKSLIEN